MTDLRFTGPLLIVSVQTPNPGSGFAGFADIPCDALDIVNSTGTAIEYRRNGAGGTIQVPNGGSRLVAGITNANQVQVRRVDQSNTQVTLTAEAML